MNGKWTKAPALSRYTTSIRPRTLSHSATSPPSTPLFSMRQRDSMGCVCHPLMDKEPTVTRVGCAGWSPTYLGFCWDIGRGLLGHWMVRNQSAASATAPILPIIPSHNATGPRAQPYQSRSQLDLEVRSRMLAPDEMMVIGAPTAPINIVWNNNP